MNADGAAPTAADVLASAPLGLVCLGSASICENATVENATLSSICVLENGQPVLLIGIGSGVLRSCLERLPSLPQAVFLPSMRLCCCSDLLAYLLLAAERRIHVKVFAASEVIDRVVDAVLDVECSELIGEYSEFLEVSPNTPTELRASGSDGSEESEPDPLNILMKECASTISDEDMSSAIGSSESRSYNLILLSNESPMVAVLEGPTHVEQLDDFALSVRSAAAVVVKRWRTCRGDQLRGFLDLSSQSVFVVQGYDSARKRQAIVGCSELQGGDAVLLGDGDGDVTRRLPPLLVPCAAPRKIASKGARKKTTPQRPPWNDDTSSQSQRSPRQNADGVVEAPDELEGDRDSSRLREVGAAKSGTPGRVAALSKAPPQWLDRWMKHHQGRFDHEDGFTYAGKIPHHQHRGDMFATPPRPPKKVFFFNFDDKLQPPAAIVIPETWSLDVIKRKVSSVLNIRPISHLVTLETGYVHSPTELVHLQQVVVLRHGGKPFSIYELPVTMSLPEIDDGEDMLPA